MTRPTTGLPRSSGPGRAAAEMGSVGWISLSSKGRGVGCGVSTTQLAWQEKLSPFSLTPETSQLQKQPAGAWNAEGAAPGSRDAVRSS